MNAGPAAYAVLSALVFTIGLYGVLTRTTTLGVLVAVSVLFAAPVIALVGFSQAGGSQGTAGAVALFAVFAAAAQVATGIGVALLVWRRTGSADIDDLVELED